MVSFAAARGLQFLAPIVVANLLSVSNYGVVEWAHASATLLAAIVTLGTNSVVPLVILQPGARGALAAVYMHQTAVAVACIAVALVAALWTGYTGIVVLVALFTGVFALQGLWTYVLRARGASSASLFVEASPFTLVALAAATAWFFAPSAAVGIIQLALLLALAVMMAAAYSGWLRERHESPRYVETLRAGVPLMLGGLLSLVAFTSGRWGIGLLGTSELTGTYSAVARVAALPIVVHQLAVTARFRDLFSLPQHALQSLLKNIALLISAAAITLLVMIPWVAPLFGAAFARAAEAHPVATVMLVTQVILWSGVAQNDLISSRYSLFPRLLPWTMTVLILSMAIAAAVLLRQGVSVDSFAIWHTALMGMLFSVQCGMMARMGVRFTRYWLVCAVTFVLITGAGLAWVA